MFFKYLLIESIPFSNHAEHQSINESIFHCTSHRSTKSLVYQCHLNSDNSRKDLTNDSSQRLLDLSCCLMTECHLYYMKYCCRQPLAYLTATVSLTRKLLSARQIHQHRQLLSERKSASMSQRLKALLESNWSLQIKFIPLRKSQSISFTQFHRDWIDSDGERGDTPVEECRNGVA